MKLFLFVCAFVALPSVTAVAADSPWTGTWKQDLARSHLTGDTFSYSKAPNGLIHYSDGSAYSYEFAVDGKEYKTFENRTVTWTAAGDNAWNTVAKQDGKVIYETHREISPDGKTMTVTATGKAPDGSAMNNAYTSARLTGSKGLIGKWRSTKTEMSIPDVVIISSPAPGVLRMENPNYKAIQEGKTDGTEITSTGPMVAAGYTTSWKLLAPGKLSTVNKLNGKIDSYSMQTLAADGKTFTEVDWNAGTPSQKTTSVYVKQ